MLRFPDSQTSCPMQQIVIHRKDFPESPSGILRTVLSSESLAALTLAGLRKLHSLDGFPKNPLFVIPRQWQGKPVSDQARIQYYEQTIPVMPPGRKHGKTGPWQIITNGRYVTDIDAQWLFDMVNDLDAPVLAVQADSELTAFREKIRFTSQGTIAGFRRWYADTAKECAVPADWPPHFLVKADILPKLLVDGTLPLHFSEVVSRCTAQSLPLRSIRLAGVTLDLETEEGFLALIDHYFRTAWPKIARRIPSPPANQANIDDSVRIFGNVWIGQEVCIRPGVILIGPAVIGDRVELGAGVTIQSSVVGPGLTVPENYFIKNRVLTRDLPVGDKLSPASPVRGSRRFHLLARAFNQKKRQDTFRTWPRISYAAIGKPVLDRAAALLILLLFVPVLPFIALAVKLSSPGPVFFRHKRQGLHGKEFGCLKFRTMIQGADDLQRKLRKISQVDGPQFKIDDDPRVSPVGKFLRDTYLDEIPQFFNVLLGQMSLIGPRPSPVPENTLCPPWRDARLSVRPGVTGLWQICRTRQDGQDFQEWIHYDIKYVKNLSFRLDGWIFWQTVKKMVKEFARQF